MANARTNIMYINNQQEVVVCKLDNGIQIKHRMISDDPSKPNSFSDVLYIPLEDLYDFNKMIDSL